MKWTVCTSLSTGFQPGLWMTTSWHYGARVRRMRHKVSSVRRRKKESLVRRYFCHGRQPCFLAPPLLRMRRYFSAVVVCVHPCQDLMTIKDGASDLMSFAHSKPGKSISALCRLPRKSAKAFYPSPLNDSFLILPYFAFPGKQKKVHLNAAIGLNKHFVVRRLHRRRAPGGDLAVLPPIYSKDPSVPGTLEVGYMGPMWANTVHVTVMPEGGTGLFLPADQNVRPAISMVQFCPEEMDARSSLAPLVGDNVVYPEKWRDKPYEIQKVEKAQRPRRDGSSRDSSESDGEPSMDGTPAAPPPT